MKAIILAAGEGTRLRPLTLEIPKAMVEVFGKPLLAHNIDKLTRYVDEFILVVKYREEIIRQYFGESYKGIPISYHTQGEKKGTGAAVQGIDITGDIIIAYADAIFRQSDIDRVMQQNEYAVLAKEVENPEKYGIFEISSEGYIKKVVEKPQTYIGNLANFSFFKVNETLLSYVSQIPESPRGEIEITDALNLFCKQEKMKAVILKHDFIDITSLEDLKKVHNYEDIAFGETRYIEHIGENELYYGIAEKHVQEIIDYTADNGDQALQKNTSDSKRFASPQTMQKWYADTGRRVFTLISPEGNLLGITYYRPSLAPDIIEVHDTILCDTLKNTLHSSTGGIRLYPLARGKGLAKDFLNVSERVYRSEFADTLICMDIEEENIPSRKCFEGCGYTFAGYGENKKSVANAVHRRRIYMK